MLLSDETLVWLDEIISNIESNMKLLKDSLGTKKASQIKDEIIQDVAIIQDFLEGVK